MKDLTKVFIDLSKCSEEQQKHIFSLLPEPLISSQYKIFSHFKFLCYERAMRIWIATSIEVVCNRTELTYPEFIKLFEGGEGENGGWTKIESEADLPKENIQFWGYDKIENAVYSANFRYPTDIGWMIYRFSHYQPLIKPEPPKF